MISNIFYIPINDKLLLHAPLHGITALINHSAAGKIREGVLGLTTQTVQSKNSIIEILKHQPTEPKPLEGGIRNPLFLGLIPTRGCNMFCRYCDFPVSKHLSAEEMSIDTCRESIDAYFALLEEHQHKHANIHFFGGEPFYHPEAVFFAVEYANLLAAQKGMGLHVEASTNGLIDDPLLDWVTDRFNCLVLSFDGLEETQNYMRPTKQLKPSFEQVAHTASQISRSSCELVLRRCIPASSVPDLVETTSQMAEMYQPSSICLEPLTVSERSINFGLEPPDPWEFARQFIACHAALSKIGIEVILSTADLNQKTISSCPVANDALIVSPDGTVDTCYQPKITWESKGLDLRLGKVINGHFEFDTPQVKRIREEFQVNKKPLCQNCFCRFHCAGGCHINHDGSRTTGDYDNLCIQTRIVTIGKLLHKINQAGLLVEWLASITQVQDSVYAKSDRLEDWE